MTKLTFKRHALSFLFAIIVTTLYIVLFITNMEAFSTPKTREFSHGLIITLLSQCVLPIFLLLIFYQFAKAERSQRVILFDLIINCTFTFILVDLLIVILSVLALTLSTNGTEYLLYATGAYLIFCVLFLWYQCSLLLVNNNNYQLWCLLKTALYFLMGGFTLVFAIELCYLFL